MASFDEGNAVFHVCYGEAYADWMASYLYKWITSRNVSSSIGMSLGRETENLVVHSLTVFAHHPFVTHRNSNVLRAYFDLPSPRIGKTAREAFALIIERSISNQRRVPATVEWIDDTVAVVRYEHPEIEVAEREFSLISLPKGADEGDSFELNVELNVSGRVIGYPSSAGNRLTKRSTEGWEAIMLPKAVQNWIDPVDIARYDSDADAYFARVQQMRANTAIPRPPRPGK